MAEVKCRGLPAFWLNAWLAAVGATVLVPRIRLRWTGDRTPVAVLSSEDGDPVELLASSWPDAGFLDDLPIAEDWQGVGQVRRKVPAEAFVARARAARGHRHSWTLSSTMTDLAVDQHGEVAHAPFDAAGPGTIKWLHHRLVRLHGLIEPSADRIRASLSGQADRASSCGLAFDQTRLGSLADNTGGHLVDPVVEILAFFGLAILPVRGDGVDLRLGRQKRVVAMQRGWFAADEGRGGRRFKWPAWTRSLDSSAIDALLDVWNPGVQRTWGRVGVRAGWQCVRYLHRAQADRTAALGSERL